MPGTGGSLTGMWVTLSKRVAGCSAISYSEGRAPSVVVVLPFTFGRRDSVEVS